MFSPEYKEAQRLLNQRSKDFCDNMRISASIEWSDVKLYEDADYVWIEGFGYPIMEEADC